MSGKSNTLLNRVFGDSGLKAAELFGFGGIAHLRYPSAGSSSVCFLFLSLLIYLFIYIYIYVYMTGARLMLRTSISRAPKANRSTSIRKKLPEPQYPYLACLGSTFFCEAFFALRT